MVRNLAKIRTDAEAVRTIPLPYGFDEFVERVQACTEIPEHLLQVAQDPPEDRVARGVRLLDEQVPDWRERIDVQRLNVRNPKCVLGQLYGAYIDGHIALGLGPILWLEGMYHGFIVSLNDSGTASEVEACWREHIGQPVAAVVS